MITAEIRYNKWVKCINYCLDRITKWKIYWVLWRTDSWDYLVIDNWDWIIYRWSDYFTDCNEDGSEIKKDKIEKLDLQHYEYNHKEIENKINEVIDFINNQA
jgi:hypothetical protein